MDRDALRGHRLANALQSAALLAAMAALAAAAGGLLAGADGVLVALFALLGALLFAPAVGPETLLRLYGARRLDASEAPGLLRLMDELALRAGLPATPALWYLPTRMVNAFAVGGRRRAAITVSDGLLRALGGRELAAVLAHEVCHLRHGDTRVMGLADLLSRLTHLLAMTGLVLLAAQLPLAVFGLGGLGPGAVAAGLLLVVSPAAAALLQLALSRTREYDADLGAAELTGDPQALASALARIDSLQRQPFEQILLPGRRLPEPSLLRTHPPTEERVRRLLALAPPARPRLDWLLARGHWQPRGAAPRLPRWHLNGLWY